MPKRILSAEYKRECVELVMTMGIGLSTIQRWVSQYQKEQQGFTPKAVAISPEQQRIQALEKQVKQLQSDNTLLPRYPWVKKVSAFFTMEINNGNKLR